LAGRRRSKYRLRVIKPQGVPKLLIDMAIRELGKPLTELAQDGGRFDDHAWLYLDGRLPPGRPFAIQQIALRGSTLEQATRAVDAQIKRARANGELFALGVMLPCDELLALLEKLAGGRTEGLEMLRAWLAQPPPEKAFRVVVISGSATQLLHVAFTHD
jgi:hypothetical protein